MERLPDDLSALRLEAASEGFRFIERLADAWNAGTTIFDKPGEALLVARCDGRMAGIGGMTIDPFDATALRIRRFSVRPCNRRQGIARILAATLLSEALATTHRITVNAGTDVAPAFWESMGFKRVSAEPHTHVLGQGSAAMRQEP